MEDLLDDSNVDPFGLNDVPENDDFEVKSNTFESPRNQES